MEYFTQVPIIDNCDRGDYSFLCLSPFELRVWDRKEMINHVVEWNIIEKNEFNFIVIWIAKDGKE